MNYQEYETIKETITKEVEDNIIKKIEVNDSFFYATMVISQVPDVFGFKLRATIKIKLFNSQQFEYDHLINNKPKTLDAKTIVSKVEIDETKLKSDQDLMMVIYDEVGKQIAADLFQENAANINRVSYEMQRRYI